MEGIDYASFGRAFLYLGVGFLLMIFYLQWRWSKTCANNLQIWVDRATGKTDYILAPIESGIINVQPDTKDSAGNPLPAKTWVYNKTSTTRVCYPGVGFIPSFLQKEISMVHVDESDWEPITNRHPQHKLVGSPEFLHNIINEKVSQLAVIVAKDVIQPLTKFMSSLKGLPKASYVYIGLGLILIICAVMVFRVMPLSTEVANNAADLQLIKQSLGIPIPPVVP